ncbi:unnamed protein product, partial [Candidula unifasciata]
YLFNVSSVTLHFGVFFLQTISPVLIVFGTIGNLLSILVMSRRKMRSSNAAVYLISLAIADTGALIIGLLRFFVAEPICKIRFWLTFVSLDISAWVLVAFTIERFLSVCFPHRLKTFCTQKSSIIAVVCIAVVMLAHNSHFLYGYGDVIITYENTSILVRCIFVSDNYSDFFYNIHIWISLCVNCFIPLVIFIVCNSFIATKVLLRSRKMHKIAEDKTAKYASRESLAVTGRQESNSRLTIMLFTVTIVFLITTAPIRVLFILLPSLQFQTSKDYAVLYLTHKVTVILMYTNNSVNFILYCVTGSKFRNEVLKMFRELCNRIGRINPTNDAENVCSRRQSLIARQIITEVTELPPKEIVPLQIPDDV